MARYLVRPQHSRSGPAAGVVVSSAGEFPVRPLAGADVRSRAPLLSSVQLSSRGRSVITPVPPAPAGPARSGVQQVTGFCARRASDVCTGPTAVTAVNWAHAGNHLTSGPVQRWPVQRSAGQYALQTLESYSRPCRGDRRRRTNVSEERQRW